MERDGQSLTAQPNPEALERCEETLWVVQAREGNVEAFSHLVARHERPLLYYLRRFIRQPEAALDAHQEVWLDAFRGLRRLQAPEAFRAWLYKIAHAKAVRFIQREIRDEELNDALEQTHPKVSTQFEPPCDAEAIHRALDQLPSLQREVLTLHYLQDLTLEEMAIALDCPLGTIKSRLHHARAALRSLLGKEQP